VNPSLIQPTINTKKAEIMVTFLAVNSENRRGSGLVFQSAICSGVNIQRSCAKAESDMKQISSTQIQKAALPDESNLGIPKIAPLARLRVLDRYDVTNKPRPAVTDIVSGTAKTAVTFSGLFLPAIHEPHDWTLAGRSSR
jgi:hypothetical protein